MPQSPRINLLTTPRPAPTSRNHHPKPPDSLRISDRDLDRPAHSLRSTRAFDTTDLILGERTAQIHSNRGPHYQYPPNPQQPTRATLLKIHQLPQTTLSAGFGGSQPDFRMSTDLCVLPVRADRKHPRICLEIAISHRSCPFSAFYTLPHLQIARDRDLHARDRRSDLI